MNLNTINISNIAGINRINKQQNNIIPATNSLYNKDI